MSKLFGPDVLTTYTSDWAGPFDGLTLTSAVLHDAGHGLFPWEMSSENEWWGRPLKAGEIGCTLAHWSCWKDAQRRKVSYVLVLEDDAVPDEGFLGTLLDTLGDLADFEDLELLYLGRFPLEPDITTTRHRIVRPGYSHCTFAYLLTQSAVQKILATHLNESIIPVDEFLPAMYIDHPRLDVRARFPRKLNALAFNPPLVRQLPKEIAGSDTENSPFVTW